MELDPSPCPLSDKALDARFLDAVALGDLRLHNPSSGIERPDFTDQIRRQFRATTVFLAHVVGVILGRAEKQMGRINTRRIVAAMEDKPIIWKRPEFRREHDARGRHYPTIAATYPPIPMSVGGPRPQPALIVASLVNVLKGPINNRDFPPLVHSRALLKDLQSMYTKGDERWTKIYAIH